MMLLPYTTIIYVDEYVLVTAELEILTAEIRKAIRGNPNLDDFYFERLAERPSIEEKLFYARHFRRNLEYYRSLVDNGL